MRCELCGKPTRCSCRWGGCPSCWNNNKVIALMNDLLKFWVDKATVRKEMSFIKVQLGKIDSYTLYEYLVWEITEEQYNEAVANFNPSYKAPKPKRKVEVKDFKPTVNPERQCVFEWPWQRERCIHCNSIRKYMQWKECPSYKK